MQGSAMRIDAASGVVYIDPDRCTGCRLCYYACPFEPKRISFNLDSPQKALKCDMCRARQERPACVEYCQVRCIGLSDEPLPYTSGGTGEEVAHG
jgi:Fe-S-cluster-containing dehydrogenase component